MKISVVIPVYGCRKALPELHRRLVDVFDKMGSDYELVLVDDCCPQNSWEEIEKLCAKDKKVIGMRMSRNFGQIKAITAGLDNVTGDYVVVMDCDLQDRPEPIPEMFKKIEEGYDVVFAKREGRKDSAITKFLSKAFYKVYDYFTNGNFDNSICNFSISKKKVIDAYCRMREQNRAFTMFIKWLGFEQTAISLPADERFEGKSSYNMKRKLKLAFEVITSQSNKPLMFSISLGFIISVLAFIYIVYLVIKALVLKDTLVGWTTIVASIYLMGGILLCAVGVVGIYVGNIFNEVKNRPIYVISKTINKNTQGEEK